MSPASQRFNRMVIGGLVLVVALLQLAICTKARSETVTARVPSLPDTGEPGADLTFTVQVLKPQKVTVRVPNRALPGFGGPQFFQDLAGQYVVLQGELVDGELLVIHPGNVARKPAREKRPRADCPPDGTPVAKARAIRKGEDTLRPRSGAQTRSAP
jgi:hypothetical protein